MRAKRLKIELPTLAVAITIYGGWLALIWFHARLPEWAIVIFGGWLIAWHGSLQHETIHGHPTPNARLNTLIGGIPLSLWLPYAIYRRKHLAHHRSPAITDPLDDPESRYLGRDAGRISLMLSEAESSLLGRVTVGPIVAVGRFWVEEFQRACRQPVAAFRDWGPHLAGSAVIIAWLDFCGFGLGHYALACLYPGTALTLFRSFAEHRASKVPGHRIAIVEDRGPLALLYLNNNLHATHHHAPGLPWYALPSFHRQHREALLFANGGLTYRDYRDVAARFLLRRHDVTQHPDHAR